MATYKSINPETRIYPSLALEIAPDETATIDFDGDIAGLVIVPASSKNKSPVSSDSTPVDPQPATNVAPEQGA